MTDSQSHISFMIMSAILTVKKNKVDRITFRYEKGLHTQGHVVTKLGMGNREIEFVISVKEAFFSKVPQFVSKITLSHLKELEASPSGL